MVAAPVYLSTLTALGGEAAGNSRCPLPCPFTTSQPNALLPAQFTAARIAGHDNFSGLLLNVGGVDVGYFNEKRIR